MPFSSIVERSISKNFLHSVNPGGALWCYWFKQARVWESLTNLNKSGCLVIFEPGNGTIRGLKKKKKERLSGPFYIRCNYFVFIMILEHVLNQSYPRI